MSNVQKTISLLEKKGALAKDPQRAPKPANTQTKTKTNKLKLAAPKWLELNPSEKKCYREIVKSMPHLTTSNAVQVQLAARLQAKIIKDGENVTATTLGNLSKIINELNRIRVIDESETEDFE